MKRSKSFVSSAALACALGLATVGCSTDKEDFICIYYPPYENGVIELSSGDFAEARGGIVYYQGDIALTDQQYQSLQATGSVWGNDTLTPSYMYNVNPVTNMPSDSTTRNIGLLWAMVRFTYDESLSASQRDSVKKALLCIQANTNVRFYNATGLPNYSYKYNVDYPCVNFKYKVDDMSSSMIGCVGEIQDICLTDVAFDSIYVIEHEICHALGMYHEQCRPDRDDYVTVCTSNLTEKGQTNFSKPKNYTTFGAYDFLSVMGCSSYTSLQDMVVDTSKPMYLKKDGSPIYRGKKLSDGDRRWLNYYYLPYVARSDSYLELDSVVYDANNVRLTEQQRIRLQSQLNGGKATPPAGGRIANEL